MEVGKMNDYKLTPERIAAFGRHLRAEEHAPGTIEKYLRDVGAFARWLGNGVVTKEAAVAWKDYLLSTGYAPVTVNSMLAALNQLFRFLGWHDYRLRFLKIQRRMFRAAGRELTRGDYDALVTAAQERGQERLNLLMETICATGIRVSEVQYITIEAIRRERAEICLKGKIRIIFFQGNCAVSC